MVEIRSFGIDSSSDYSILIEVRAELDQDICEKKKANIKWGHLL